MTAKRATPIRVGDRVRVVVPRAVARVGYPKEARDYLAKVVEEREAEVRKLFGYRPAYPGIDEVFPVGSSATHVAWSTAIVEARVAKLPPPLRRALWDLAYLACKRDGFGGRERRVRLTDPLRGWDDVEFEVAAVRSVMEGDYFAPSYSRDYWTGESDNEPGGLSNQRVRRLAAVGRTLSARVHGVAIVRLTERKVEFPVEHLEVVEPVKARERAARGTATAPPVGERGPTARPGSPW